MCRGPMLYGAITRAGLKLMLWCLFCAQLKTVGQPVKTLGEEGKKLKEQNQQLIEEQRKRGRVVDDCQAPPPRQNNHTPGMPWYNSHQALLSTENNETSKPTGTGNATCYITIYRQWRPRPTVTWLPKQHAFNAERRRLSTTCSYRRDGSPNCSSSWVGVEKRWTS